MRLCTLSPHTCIWKWIIWQIWRSFLIDVNRFPSLLWGQRVQKLSLQRFYLKYPQISATSLKIYMHISLQNQPLCNLRFDRNTCSIKKKSGFGGSWEKISAGWGHTDTHTQTRTHTRALLAAWSATSKTNINRGRRATCCCCCCCGCWSSVHALLHDATRRFEVKCFSDSGHVGEARKVPGTSTNIIISPAKPL